MGLRFRRSVRLFPGVRLNFSRSGVSTSIGVRGATMTLGPRGAYANVGIPGSGLSYRTRLDTPSTARKPVIEPAPHRLSPAEAGRRPPTSTPGLAVAPGTETLIRSADVSVLTSPGLGELKRLINEAAIRRGELSSQMVKGKTQLDRAAGRLRFAQFLVVRLFTEKAIPRLVEAANKAKDELDEATSKFEGCFIEVDFAFDDATRNSYAALIRTFEALRTAQRIWDITATSVVNRVAERTVASTAIRRVPVSFDLSDSEIIRSQYRAMRLGNVAGRDIQIFPGFVMMRDATRDFALIEFAHFDCQLAYSNFVEEEAVPSDAERVGTTWKRANKDGSRDRRFNDNFEIPILCYGALAISSPTGLNEVYQISSYDEAGAFAHAIVAHKASLADLNTHSDAPGLPAPSDETDDADVDDTTSLPAFVAKPRNNLIVDWVTLVFLVGGVVFGAFWTDQHWGQLASAFAASPPPPVVATPPAPAAPVVHKIHRRHHHLAKSTATPTAATEPADLSGGTTPQPTP
jgi:Protein of unknown function (DUF4236)